MRFFQSCIFIFWIGAAGTLANAQTTWINGPTLGFTTNSKGTAISPIIGIAGASLLAPQIDLGSAIHGAVISPRQDYALATQTIDGQIVVIDLTTGSAQMTPIDGAPTGPVVMAISPAGSVAALLDAGSGVLQVIGGLPGTPQVIRTLDASGIAGRADSLAISDDGSVALIKAVSADGAGLWVINASGAASRLPLNQPSTAAFFANRNDAIVGDDATQSALIITDAGGTATQVPLVSNVDGMNSFSSIAASDDGRQVFLADSGSGNIAIVDMQTRRPVLLASPFPPTAFYRLKGKSIYGLNQASGDPMMVLDASSGQPRITLVPPLATAVTEGAQ